MIRICVAGATGWVGRSLVPEIVAAPDLELVGAVSRTAQGKTLGEALGLPDLPLRLLRITGSVEEALAAETDVLIDYTSPESAKANVLQAIARKVHVVIGTSGLNDDDFREIDEAARRHGVGVLAAGNFAISAVLLQHFAVIAARYMPSWEVIDYSDAGKPDAPSGTTREIVHRLAKVRAPEVAIPIGETQGFPAARGLTLNGTQIHSIRLPGYVIAAEVIFGKPNELLSLRYTGGSGAEPYVDGTLLAARRVGGFVGLRRGLDQVLDLA
ncbi:MAG TPA: 4-hydroxy-tetrahydrodipicolinate reductase [Thermoanaerobaculia bacterium]|jgi:4-hydroxy-tetrahydrodipicolinate reductase|nr:4-hydroxy-tetrahydrodipicolinate reductase [Thermoanaerobaculia bacterium]